MLYYGYWIGSNFFPCSMHSMSASHTYEKIVICIYPKQAIQTPELLDRLVCSDLLNSFIYDGLLFQAKHRNGYEYLVTKVHVQYRDTPFQEDQIYTLMEMLATEFTFNGIRLL